MEFVDQDKESYQPPFDRPYLNGNCGKVSVYCIEYGCTCDNMKIIKMGDERLTKCCWKNCVSSKYKEQDENIPQHFHFNTDPEGNEDKKDTKDTVQINEKIPR